MSSSRRPHVGRRLLAALAALVSVAISLSSVDTPVDAAVPAAEGDRPLPQEVVGDPDPLVSTVPDALGWGVDGIGDYVHITTNLRVPVYALQQIGDRIFVGGSFAEVRQSWGQRTENQSFLAAFDLETGAWIEDWRPQLDASVYALAATSDGKLIVGGDFTSVDGTAHTAALAALDPITGEVLTGWRSGLERPWSDDPPVVRALEVHGELVYAGGNFSHHTSLASRTRVHKVIRVAASNGNLDTSWVPEINGAGLW